MAIEGNNTKKMENGRVKLMWSDEKKTNNICMT